MGQMLQLEMVAVVVRIQHRLHPPPAQSTPHQNLLPHQHQRYLNLVRYLVLHVVPGFHGIAIIAIRRHPRQHNLAQRWLHQQLQSRKAAHHNRSSSLRHPMMSPHRSQQASLAILIPVDSVSCQSCCLVSHSSVQQVSLRSLHSNKRVPSMVRVGRHIHPRLSHRCY